jgi:hypothetical protein
LYARWKEDSKKGQEIIVIALIMLGHVENCHVLIDDLRRNGSLVFILSQSRGSKPPTILAVGFTAHLTNLFSGIPFMIPRILLLHLI